MQQSSVTNYFKPTKKRPREAEAIQPNKLLAISDGCGSAALRVRPGPTLDDNGDKMAIPFVHKGLVSPKKQQQQEQSKVQLSKGKLGELKAALQGLDGCRRKLDELRRVKGQDSKKSESSGVTPEKFYSPGKVVQENIFESPKKLKDIGQEGPNSRGGVAKRLFQEGAQPAYQRFHSLATPTATTPTTPPLPLPFPLKILSELFHSLETVTSILHNRSEIITFQKVKCGVSELFRRVPLTQTHLGQILTLYPNSYKLTQEKVKTNGVTAYELVLTLEGLDTVTPRDLVQRRKLFREACLGFCLKEHQAHLLQLTSLTVPNEKITRWHPTFKLDEVKIPPTPIPTPPDSAQKPNTAAQVISKVQKMFDANPRVKRALQGMANSEQQVITPPVVVSKKKLAQLKGVSQALIDKIRLREAQKSLQSLTQTPEETKRQEMLSKLPQLVKTLRNTFIAEKKVALPFDLAVDRLMHSMQLSRATTTLHLEHLLSLLPSWLTLLPLTEGKYLKMEKQLDINELISKTMNNV